MKIISVGPAHPYRGGPAEFNNRLVKQFIAEGHESEILTFTLQYPGFLFPGKTQYTESPAPEGIRITRSVSSVNPFNWISTGLRIKKMKPDILLLRYWLPFLAPCLGLIARIARHNKHTKVVCIFDNVLPHEKRAGDRLLTKYFINSVDAAVVMSETVRDELDLFRKNLPVRYSPHPLFENYGKSVGRDEALERLGLGNDFQYILFFGLVRAYKGLDILIEAFSDRRFRSMNLKLIIAGEFYEDDAPYRAMIKKYQIGDDIIILNRFIRDDEVSSLFSAASIVVQPYKSASQSGVTQVAYHFDKPMIVTDVGGLREMVPDGICGYVVTPEPRAVADAISDYFEHNRESRFAEGVRMEKGRFSWSNMTSSIIDVYHECLKRSS
jgi:glycosyltransferase involved in cell wall biosynthesis